MMIVSGAYGMFYRPKVLSIGGYKETLGEDIFLTLELQKLKHTVIKYVPEAVAYTQVPTTFSMIRKQRMRWFKGLTESLSTFKRMWIGNKMSTAFNEFFIVEWATPVLAPYGLATIIAVPSMLLDPIFQVAMAITLATPIVQSIISMVIEASYRKVKLWKLFFLPIGILMSPLTMLWRNDGLLDYSSKVWGKMLRVVPN
jgi:cellulose synthase/poly-beta-1,6-N-acetylglucosamine synthase-like glycosyltransferase